MTFEKINFSLYVILYRIKRSFNISCGFVVVVYMLYRWTYKILPINGQQLTITYNDVN